MLSSALASDANFNKGKQVAETLKGKVPGNKNNVPQFREGFVISENETSRAFEHAKNNETSKAVMEIHTSRGRAPNQI